MFKYLPFILLFLHAVQGIRRSFKVPDTKIVGGMKAPDGGVPYQASLRRPSSAHFCGGTIIDKRWIMTAAHCCVEFNAGDISAVVGTNKLIGGHGESYRIERIIVNEKYDNKTVQQDICLLRTKKNIKLSNKVQPIALPTKDTQAGANILLTGWGREEYKNGPIPNDLQMLNQTVISTSSCKDAYSEVNPVIESELCTMTPGNKGACQGDSGGPLVEENQVVGIVSWGVDCAYKYPDVNTRVYSFVDWINSQMSKYD